VGARPRALPGTPRVAARREHGDRWLFRFSLPLDGGKRTSAVRIAAVQGGVQVEHLVVLEGAQLAHEPTADALEKALGSQARWRPRDSPDTTSRFGAQRTWSDRSGARKLFRRHMTVGHGVDPQRCAQVYYEVAADGKVELAWVGEHRPTVSEDT
jgi:hypothetical protein